jgi:coenzyme F420-0:L-glutamate ligase/coenzyme F420-1:gamma-L-glutamate ligase
MIVKPIKTRIFKEGENLFDFVIKYIKKPAENSVVVVTSKIVALSEKRTIIIKNKNTKDETIREESDFVIRSKFAKFAIKNGNIIGSAGVDESNGNGKLILLPKDSFASARKLRAQLKKKFNIKNIGVLITDSRRLPLRLGIIGAAIGYHGFNGIKNHKGRSDIFGRKFHFSQTNVADSLATSAVLTIGECDEQQPLAVITDPPIEFCDTPQDDMSVRVKDDIYAPIFLKILKSKPNH